MDKHIAISPVGKPLVYECSIEEYQGANYLYVRLIKGDITGGDNGNFSVFKNQLLEKIGTQAIDKILIDASEHRDLIDSAAVGGLALLHRRKQTTVYGLVPDYKKAVMRISEVKLADDKESALEMMLNTQLA